MNATDWIGAVGVGLILTAYLLQTIGFLNNQGKWFFIINAIGASLACYASWLLNYWPFVILEGTWVMVSVYGLFKPAT